MIIALSKYKHSNKDMNYKDNLIYSKYFTIKGDIKGVFGIIINLSYIIKVNSSWI